MSFQDSRDNLTANIVQQISALLIAIVVPLLLSVEEYAQVVVVGVLVSFIQLADLGMSVVYTRKLPALYANNKQDEIRIWNSTLSHFRFFTSLVFGGAVFVYYFQRYPHGLNAGMLFMLVVFSVVTMFVILNATVQSDFRYVRNITMAQSLARMTILPCAWLAGVKGWFLGQLFSAVAMLFSRRFRNVLYGSLTDIKRIQWTLIRDNIAQGLILCMITTLWLQLLSSGRIYAAFFYPEAVVSQYGLVSSIYQIVVSMGIAAFVPQTIKIYRLVEQDQLKAIVYAFKLIIYSAPVFILSGIILTYVAPIIVEIIFPKYNIDNGIYAPLMLSLFNCAVMVTQGALLIGMGKTKPYLALIAMALPVYFIFIHIFASTSNYLAAAVAQLLTLSIYSIAILMMVCFMFKKIIVNKMIVWMACLPSFIAPLIYFILRKDL